MILTAARETPQNFPFLMISFACDGANVVRECNLIIIILTLILITIPILNFFLTMMKVKGRGSSGVGLKPDNISRRGRWLSGEEYQQLYFHQLYIFSDCINRRWALMFSQKYVQLYLYLSHLVHY